MVTIYDVAEAAGFSPATVSKAFNSYRGINKKTYNKIMDTARRMGYTPNITARTLITKKSWLVGILFSEDVFTAIKGPHFGEIVSSAQIQLGKAGYDVVFINNHLGGGNVSYLEHCQYRGVDGVIIAAPAPFGESVRCLIESPVKMVSVETTYPNKYSVISENYNGAMLAMEHLYSLGHRKIAHIAVPLHSLAAKERYKGYCDFLSSKNLPFEPDLVIEAGDYFNPAGYDAALRLLQKSKGRFTALFAAYDDVALAAMNCFKANGLSVPDDVSVVGFDDMSHTEIAGLTTIRQNREKIGCLAADVLIAQMQDAALDFDYDIRVPTSLVPRLSCRAI